MDILCVSETWVSPHTPSAYVNVPDYDIYRCDKGRGSGVYIYVKQSLGTEVIITTITHVTGIEDVWLKIQSRKLPSIIIGCIYRHPKAHSDSHDYITDILRAISLHKKPMFILGDLNDDLLNINSKLLRIFKQNKLTQIINGPTRITSTSATLLNVIITNKHKLVLKSEVFPHLIADHDLITTTINITKPKSSPIVRTFRELKQYDKGTFCEHIIDETTNLNKILITDNVNEQVNTLTKVLNKCLDRCALSHQTNT